MQITVSVVKCPKCGAVEDHPNGQQVLIRAFKVEIKGRWHSQCLVCSGLYDENLEDHQEKHDPAKGWFVS